MEPLQNFPMLPDLPDVPPHDRELLAEYWRRTLEQQEREHEERVELLRTVGEHPSPIFARMVREHGSLGMGSKFTARMCQISEHTLKTHYWKDYELGAASVLAKVAANAIRIGTSISDPANAKTAMEILARRGSEDWKPATKRSADVTEQEKPKNVIDSARLTPEQREQLRVMVESLQNDSADNPGEAEGGDPIDGAIGRLDQLE
jgi:hypothetical protein